MKRRGQRPLPGVGDRIRERWETFEARYLAEHPELQHRSTRGVAQAVGLDPGLLYSWIKSTVPSYEGLLQLQGVLGVPWQWLLIGDDGLEALRRFVEHEAATTRPHKGNATSAEPEPEPPDAEPPHEPEQRRATRSQHHAGGGMGRSHVKGR